MDSTVSCYSTSKFVSKYSSVRFDLKEVYGLPFHDKQPYRAARQVQFTCVKI